MHACIISRHDKLLCNLILIKMLKRKQISKYFFSFNKIRFKSETKNINSNYYIILKPINVSLHSASKTSTTNDFIFKFIRNVYELSSSSCYHRFKSAKIKNE